MSVPNQLLQPFLINHPGVPDIEPFKRRLNLFVVQRALVERRGDKLRELDGPCAVLVNRVEAVPDLAVGEVLVLAPQRRFKLFERERPVLR